MIRTSHLILGPPPSRCTWPLCAMTIHQSNGTDSDTTFFSAAGCVHGCETPACVDLRFISFGILPVLIFRLLGPRTASTLRHSPGPLRCPVETGEGESGAKIARKEEGHGDCMGQHGHFSPIRRWSRTLRGLIPDLRLCGTHGKKCLNSNPPVLGGVSAGIM